jgi:uncharacterized membrane protein (DUF485 family)
MLAAPKVVCCHVKFFRGRCHLAGFGHHANQMQQEDPGAVTFNARLGMWLFLLYASFYGGFVLISTFRPAWMQQIIAGVNLAVWYGFGLIVFALVLALVYMVSCRSNHPQEVPLRSSKEEQS